MASHSLDGHGRFLDVLHDLTYAWRSLARNRLFSLGAIATLGLGIGVNSTIFTLANAVLFRPLAGVVEPDRLAWISSIQRDRGRPSEMAYPDFVDYQAASRDVFSEMLAFRPAPLNTGGDGEPERLRGHFVSGAYFSTLGVPPAAGRVLDASDDRRGASPVVVLSHRLWMRRFDGNADVVQRRLIVGGRPLPIVGVAADGFAGPVLGEAADVWIPLAAWPDLVSAESAVLDDRGASWLSVMGRLRPGSDLGRAQAVMSALAARLETTYRETNADRGVVVSAAGPLPPAGRSEMLPLAALLMSVTTLVLLIACSNVANLMLARGAGRSLELGVRVAIGATRGRLIRQLLTESVVVAAAGGACGLLLSFWGADLLASFLPPADFAALAVAADTRVVLFTAGLAIASVCAFGLVPAFTASRAALSARLRETPSAGGRSRLQRAFVVAQLSLSLVLLLAAGLSLRALQKANAIELGFNPRQLFTASYDTGLQNYPRERQELFRRELVSRALALPGIRSAAIANLAPLSGIMISTAVATADTGVPAERRSFVNAVGPGYFGTLELPLVRGRGITDSDGRGAPGAAVVNQTLARQLWPDSEAVGRALRIGDDLVQVVGVAADSKYGEPTEQPRPFLYLSLAQHSQFGRETIIVRTGGPPALAGPELREQVRRLDPALPVYDARSFDVVLTDRADKQRAMSALFAAFGGLALALAALGLYGVMAYAVARRTREIGIRLALGASPAQVAAGVTREGLRLALVGVGIGAVLALPLAQVMGALVFGVRVADVATFALTSALLVGVAGLASLLPARRAARLDPIDALRAD